MTLYFFDAWLIYRQFWLAPSENNPQCYCERWYHSPPGGTAVQIKYDYGSKAICAQNFVMNLPLMGQRLLKASLTTSSGGRCSKPISHSWSCLKQSKFITHFLTNYPGVILCNQHVVVTVFWCATVHKHESWQLGSNRLPLTRRLVPSKEGERHSRHVWSNGKPTRHYSVKFWLQQTGKKTWSVTFCSDSKSWIEGASHFSTASCRNTWALVI